MVSYRSNVVEKRKTIATLVVAVLVVLYILSVGGCDLASEENIVKEINEPHYQRAMEELRRGNQQEALSAFLKVVEKRKDAPESHLELGRIYLNDMNDPIFAIYHFRKYLEVHPNSSASMQVRQMIDTAKKHYAASLPESPFENNIRRLELEEMWQKSQKENLELKQKLAAAIEKLDKLEAISRVSVVNRQSKARVSAEVQQKPAMQRVTTQQKPTQGVVVSRDIPPTYVTQPGDTLSTISKRFYGTQSRWPDIFKANRDRLASPNSVRPGQTLRLPR